MAERAHPDEPAFQARWRIKLRKGFVPWLTKKCSPYRTAFFWRYEWVNGFCHDKDVIDIPCGMGWGTSLIKNARSLRGFDLNSDAISEARSRYGRHAKFETCDMRRLAVDNASADVVCCLEGIEHVPVDVGYKFLEEANRVLRPQGRLLISSPYCRTKSHSGNPYHIHEYQPDEIRDALSVLFDIEGCETRNVGEMVVLYFNCRKRT